MPKKENMTGKVYLVGAGPGDPGLITVKGLECISTADVVVYDRLISKKLLSHARKDAELVYVGKEAGHHYKPQEEINETLLSFAMQGKTVVRLKGGDPFIFGRGGEEAVHLAQNNIPFEVIPGVTSGLAAPAYSGIPLTHRDWTSSVAFVTGHSAQNKNQETPDWEKIGAAIGTIVIYMGRKNIKHVTSRILKSGRSPDTPAAAIHSGTTGDHQTIVTDLQHIADRVEENDLASPIIVVIGDVVNLRDVIRWFD